MARYAFTILILLIILVQPVQAQGDASVGLFRTETLYKLAQSLHIAPDSISKGFSCDTIEGLCLSFIKEDSVITHIGYHLFSEESHNGSRSNVLGFIERIFLQMMYPGDRTKEWILRDYKLKFEKGGLSDVKRILPSDEFTLSIVAGKKANAVWSQAGKPYLDFSFPMEYSLLSGEDKVEAETNFEKDLQNTIPLEVKMKPQDINTMTKTIQNNFFTKKGNSYIDKRLNSDTYYQLKDSVFTLLLDITFPAESSANMMLDMATGGDYQLEFKQILYGFKQKEFSVSLNQWLTFCHRQDCKLYFGVEKVLSTEVRASVIAVNEMAGYNHVVFVKIPYKVIDDKRGVIEAQIHTYVPMHNVTSLFESYKKRSKKDNKKKIE